MKTQIFDDITKKLWEIKNTRDSQGMPIILQVEPTLVMHPQARYELMRDERMNYEHWCPFRDTIFSCQLREDRFMAVGTWKLEARWPSGEVYVAFHTGAK